MKPGFYAKFAAKRYNHPERGDWLNREESIAEIADMGYSIEEATEQFDRACQEFKNRSQGQFRRYERKRLGKILGE